MPYNPPTDEQLINFVSVSIRIPLHSYDAEIAKALEDPRTKEAWLSYHKKLQGEIDGSKV